MENLRFRSTDSRQQAFAKDVRKRVNSYFREKEISTYGGKRLYFKSFVMLTLYLAPFILILTLPVNPWLALGLMVLMGIGEAGLGMSVMHDGAHGSFSSKPWLNELAASSMFLMGSNTVNWKIQHNLKHHTFTNTYKFDKDISSKGGIRLCEHADRRNFHRFQHLYAFPLYGLMTFSRLFGEISSLITYNKQNLTRRLNVRPKIEMIKLITIKVLYLLVIIGLPLWLTDYSIWQILLGFTVMHVVAGMIMSTVFQMAHIVEGSYQPLPDENLEIQAEWFVHQLRSTSDFGRNNGLLSWYIGGLDYQIEHHLFQNISHVHYPAIAPIVEATAEEYGYTYNLKPSFFHALKSHYRRLKELGREG